ncbi:MAG: cytoplasmic protein [Oscillatoriales cyanobacterium]|nr:MAG: cytoplasmic protein [Oscillatoriales cyanobacterium]
MAEYKRCLEIPTCRAFPKGIPLIFVVGGGEHIKPLPDQGNTIVYEPIEHTKPLPDQDNTIVYEPAEKPFWQTE